MNARVKFKLKAVLGEWGGEGSGAGRRVLAWSDDQRGEEEAKGKSGEPRNEGAEGARRVSEFSRSESAEIAREQRGMDWDPEIGGVPLSRWNESGPDCKKAARSEGLQGQAGR